MSHKKYFNVWIVYSDLFSNLSVFLFISALGLFAAFGQSGSPNLPLHTPSPEACAAESRIVTAAIDGPGLDGAASLFGSPVFAKGRERDCEEHYRLDGLSFPRQHADIYSLWRGKRGDGWRDAFGRQMMHQVCEQIWGAATRADLEDKNGHVLIGATGTAETALCVPNYREDTVRAAPIAYMLARNVEVQRQQLDCIVNLFRGETDISQVCRAFKAAHPTCFRARPADTDECAFLSKYFREREFVHDRCVEGFEATRAQSIYDYCRQSVRDTKFNLGAIETVGALPDAKTAAHDREYMILRDIWRKHVRLAEETRGAAGEPLFAPHVGDVIFLSVQFDLTAAQP